MRKTLILLGALAIVAAGCGGSSGSGTPVKLSGSTADKGTQDLSGSSINLQESDFAFSPSFIKGGSAGATITVHLENVGQNPHTFTSSSLGVDVQLSAGESKDVTVTLPQSGASEFHCRFHQQSNGMQGAFFFKDGE